MRRINSPQEMQLYLETLNTTRPRPPKVKLISKRWELTPNARIGLIMFGLMFGPMTLLYIACKLIENSNAF